MKAIADEIHLGAMTYLREQYIRISIFMVIVAILLTFQYDFRMGVAFVFGAVTSALAGFVGMKAATKGQRPHDSGGALQRRTRGAQRRLQRRRGDGPCGRLVRPARPGRLFYLFGAAPPTSPSWGFSMGASSIALFARVGGGIYTKAADVGSDLVGKVEAGIPEDDPRNPGVIADNVGDNVGDVAGMGADLYESYVGAMVAAMAIAATLTARVVVDVRRW